MTTDNLKNLEGVLFIGKRFYGHEFIKKIVKLLKDKGKPAARRGRKAKDLRLARQPGCRKIHKKMEVIYR